MDKLLGQLTARGLSQQEIIQVLVVEGHVTTTDEAMTLITDLYTRWDHMVVPMQNQLELWHVFMRHQLLQLALQKEETRAALAILDSMATIQQISTFKEIAEKPLVIQLTPTVSQGDDNVEKN